MPQKVRSLTPNEYEAYVSQLLEKLDFATTGIVQRNQKYDGVRQPGRYEIDVSLRIQLAEALKFFLIVECKNWEKPVGRDVVQKLAQTRDAISADKAAIASPVGFTREAAEVARTLEIALWVITLDEWVVVYDNGPVALHLDLIDKERGRDWTLEPAVIHLSDWNNRGLAIFPRDANLPPHLSWARFCDLDRRDNPVYELRQRVTRLFFKERTQTLATHPDRRRGIGHGIGDATLVHSK